MKITILRGDITEQSVDAIVNAANEALIPGGGVDGAIHDAAGPRLVEACEQIPEVTPGVRCPMGEARITDGFDLPATYVIHTVGPRAQLHNRQHHLRRAYESSLRLAVERGLQTVAFPAISCGIFRYPIPEAADVAAAAVLAERWDLDGIRFVLFEDETEAQFRRAFEAANLV